VYAAEQYEQTRQEIVRSKRKRALDGGIGVNDSIAGSEEDFDFGEPCSGGKH
jgi:hypothetical protein